MIVGFNIEAEIAWRAIRDDSGWVGICDALKLTAQGETWSDLNETIDDIQQDLFVSLLAEGSLADFLQANGWTPTKPLPPSKTEGVVFDMPARVVPQRAVA